MSADPSAPFVATHDLWVRLDGRAILRGVTMHVLPGEAVAIMGENGSGKTTLLRALLGLVPISAGSADLFGVRIDRPSSIPWRRVGYVPQRLAPISGMPTTALEVVRTGLLSRRRLRLPRGADAHAQEALASVGLADRARDPIAYMSGGQQQRVAIARALVRDPGLLVLDEPAAGVDQRRQADLAAILTDLRSQGRSILIVLHDLGHFAPMLDRALVIEDGRVAREGPVHNLRSSTPPCDDAHHPDEDDAAGDGNVLATAPNELGW